MTAASKIILYDWKLSGFRLGEIVEIYISVWRGLNWVLYIFHPQQLFIRRTEVC